MHYHEFITVGHRRWCVNCDLFQTERDGQWKPTSRNCPRTTPHAREDTQFLLINGETAKAEAIFGLAQPRQAVSEIRSSPIA